MTRAALVVLIVACGSGNGTAPHVGTGSGTGTGTGTGKSTDAAVVVRSGVGRLIVHVTWPEATAADRAEGGRNACGVAGRARATIGTLHGVAGAVVIVEDVAVPRVVAKAAIAPVTIAVRGCRVEPAVVLARVGDTIDVASADERRHRVVVADAGPPREMHAWKPAVARGAIDLAWAGAEVALDAGSAGVWRLSTEASPDEASWVVIADSLAAISDEVGAASFAELAAGRHHIYVWLPERGGGGQARTAAADVDVGADQDTEITLGFARP